MIRRHFHHRAGALFAALCLLPLDPLASRAQTPAPITIVVFTAPSLGALLPGVIKEQKFDQANGLDISFAARTPDAYTAQFDSGEFQLGGSAAVLTVGLADLRGIKVSYLFNLFDYWGAVVSQRPEIKTLTDLRGKTLAAAKGTTNYEMFAWFAKRKGLDVASIDVVNTATPGLIGYALADRADAVQLWEPAYSLLLAKLPAIRTLDLDIPGEWGKFSNTAHIPYLGVAAHQSWVDEHRDLVPKLYQTYEAAARWIVAYPDTGGLAASNSTEADRQALAQLIRDNTRLGMNVASASALRPDIEAVYRAGMSLGFFDKMPSPGTIYSGPME